MPADDATRKRRVWLDIVRGLAALEVAAGHLRLLTFTGADRASSAAWKAFMVVTGQAHGAVVIFFVLSGYLIGGHVSARLETKRWSWAEYAVNRLSRLWIVLVPALLLTLVLDGIGRALFTPPPRLGALAAPAYADSSLSLGSFLGNLCFLQNGVVVGSYGVNGPLWSLANEFWYYVLFPLSLGAFLLRNAGGRVASAILAIAICAALPVHVLAYGLIWLAGAGVAHLDRCQGLVGARRGPLALVASLIFLFSLYALPRYLGLAEMPSDFIVAALFAVLVFLLAELPASRGPATKALTALSEMSYTLYLTHFPFFVLMLCAIERRWRPTPGLASTMLYVALLAAALLYAYAVYWMAERHTRSLQAGLRRLVSAWRIEPAAGWSANASAAERLQRSREDAGPG